MAATNSTASSPSTVTVCSKLPFDFAAEHDGKKVVFRGANAADVTGEKVITPGYGLTPNVDGAWFDAWAEAAGDFPALKNGVIFAGDPKTAADEANEMAPEVTTGLEQKSADELGVEVVAKDK